VRQQEEALSPEVWKKVQKYYRVRELPPRGAVIMDNIAEGSFFCRI